MVDTIRAYFDWNKWINKYNIINFLIKHEILMYRLVLQKDKSPFSFKSRGYVV
jgi:hypothetical protein